MAWEEWEQLKTAAAERQSMSMQLNQLPADSSGSGPSGSGNGAGGGERLKHAARPWSRAASTADDLRISTNTTRSTLTTAHGGLAEGITGLVSLAEIKKVLASWETRLGAVRDECETLEPKLRKVGRELVGVDAETATKVGAVTVSQNGAAR